MIGGIGTLRGRWYWYIHLGHWFCACDYAARSQIELRKHQERIHKVNRSKGMQEWNFYQVTNYLSDQEEKRNSLLQ